MTTSPFRQPWLRKLTRVLGWLLLLGYFGFALIFITLRYAVLPQIDNYHDDIERMLSSSFNLQVKIASIEAEWQGLHPRLVLRGFRIHDRQDRPALALDNVAAEISWTSLLHLGLRLNRLEIVAPTLAMRRDPQGRIFIAGLQINAPQQENDFSAWLLAQQRVVVRDASITWQDELRGAPPLTLQHLNFHLQNNGRHHRFGLIADPPRMLASRLDIRGDLKGNDLDALETWQGDAYAELDYADLAVWRTWVDYPLDMPKGSGGMRLWLSFAEKQLTSLTADIALIDVKLRLAQDLPLLDLLYLNGRISGKRLPHGFEVGAKQLTLTTRDDIRIDPTDFQLRWSSAVERMPPRGELTANGLDLGALARLATYLPIDTEVRQRLVEAAPQGKLFDLAASWSNPFMSQAKQAQSGTQGITSYSLRTRFERLCMQAQGMLPSFDGLSGSIDGNDQGGSLSLTSQKAYVDLPKLFADPRIELDALNAQLKWKMRSVGDQGERIEVKLENATFENQDAAGSASGSYLSRTGEPGEIDLQAHLSRAAGGAVWRYMPLAVGHNVRDWLHSSILGGDSNDTSLRLKGDLKRFPFADGSGVFEVKGKFHGPSLLYAQSWPRIDQITGELEFVGKRMLIKASHGEIYGVALSDVKAEIADLESLDELIVITGNATGPTADFLRFIEASPVSEHIDHFTEDMTAVGNGQLHLKLALPLRRLAETKTDGNFQFTNNKLAIDADLPLLTEVNGRLQFSGDGLKAEKVRANLLGSPMTIDVKTVGNGTVLVNTEGNLSIPDLRKQFTHPLLDHLSGSSTWRGRVRVRKKNAEVMLESKLQGISSSLPEPFNKSASEILPLRFERKLLIEPPRTGVAPARHGKTKAPAVERLTSLAVPRDQIDATLGNVLAARIVRRHEGERAERTLWERAAVAVGETLVLPDKGLLLALSLKKTDVDFWRAMLADDSDVKTGGSPVAAGKLPKMATSIALKTRELIFLDHVINDLELKATTADRDGGWRADVKSREVNGELSWLNQGAGRLSGRLKQLAINDTPGSKSANRETAGNPLDRLPGLDIEAEQFFLRDKPYGRLKLIADNRDGNWEAKLDIENDDGKLSGEGKWRPSPTQPDTNLKFSLNVKSIEKLLARLGHPDTLRRGRASMEGAVSWNGTPFDIDYPSLDGTLKVEAANGQFNKLEPGVGRLLGILSLQSIPRRITLDFRDIFSQGMAFDSITGQINLSRGIMDTHDFRMNGPSAKILISGSVNLPQETQNLKVRVSPSLGESIAVGAMLAHPAAGAIAWLADKVLKNPIDQIFAYDYAVTGSWADPKVEKLSGPQPKIENAGKP
ncbi:MAG: YhdP family protein [Sterolibacterium sp.]|nr:YhdP family protein [Sterolibacterium sp.]